uniref:Carrier domain-containing protein n=1 Tax=Thermosporothrix sp. COM3 TaxID=2490863 RepID=A0A455SMD4_9CHLR|nr:hypothetical protein KTC_28230 [Thermosporothrix sp. COM3]
MLHRDEIIKRLQIYVEQQVLDGRSHGVDEDTPLLEWGIINSMEMVRLLAFLREQFQVDIPPDKMVAAHFANLASIADLVLKTASEQRV